MGRMAAPGAAPGCGAVALELLEAESLGRVEGEELGVGIRAAVAGRQRDRDHRREGERDRDDRRLGEQAGERGARGVEGEAGEDGAACDRATDGHAGRRPGRSQAAPPDPKLGTSGRTCWRRSRTPTRRGRRCRGRPHRARAGLGTPCRARPRYGTGAAASAHRGAGGRGPRRRRRSCPRSRRAAPRRSKGTRRRLPPRRARRAACPARPARRSRESGGRRCPSARSRTGREPGLGRALRRRPETVEEPQQSEDPDGRLPCRRPVGARVEADEDMRQSHRPEYGCDQ